MIIVIIILVTANSVKRKIKLSKDEKKRQHYIKELILTEQAYIDDMSVVHDVSISIVHDL